jgi:hypothetical protein
LLLLLLLLLLRWCPRTCYALPVCAWKQGWTLLLLLLLLTSVF